MEGLGGCVMMKRPRSLASEPELACTPREALTRSAAGFELRLDAVAVLLAAFGFIDCVLRVIDDPVKAQRCTAVLIDLAVKKVPAWLAFLAMSASHAALPHLGREAMCVPLCVIVGSIVRRTGHRDTPRSIELALLTVRCGGDCGQHDYDERPEELHVY